MSQTNDCGCTPSALEVPVYGLKLSLDEQALKSLQSPPVTGAGMPVGAILLLDSDQGRALNALPAGYKADWGITTMDGAITLPNLFSEDGRGCFLRPVDGVTRQVGAEQGDAIRNITGNTSHEIDRGTPLGAFYTGPATSGINSLGEATSDKELRFDASRVVPTAEENRPLNLGMTPAVYLGV